MMEKTGYGAYIYPPSVIYDELGINDKLGFVTEPYKRRTRGNAIFEDDFQVLVTEDGFIAPLTENKELSLNYLNVLFSTLVTKFHEARHITENDLTKFVWKQSTNFIELSIKNSKSLRNQFESKRDIESTFDDWNSIPRQEIPSLFLLQMMDFAYTFYMNNEMKTDLLFIGESSGQYFDRRFGSSLLSSWIVVESQLKKILQQYLSTPEGKEKKHLLKKKKPDAHDIIQFLFEVKKISQDGVDCLTILKKTRNRITHDKSRNVTNEEAWNCLNVAISMVYNQLNKIDPFKDVKYQKLKQNDTQKS